MQQEEPYMMNCTNSLAPDDEELLRYSLDDDPLSEEARLHLAQCQICQQRLANYQQTHSFLLAHLYRRQCPDGTQLSLYCAGLLPMDEQIHIATHLLSCPLCAAEAAETRRFLAEVPVEPTSSATTYSLPQTIRRIFATPLPPSASNVVRRDHIPTLPPPAWPRQYQAESIILSLHLSRDSKKAFVLLAMMTSSDPTVSIDAYEGVDAELYEAESSREEQSTGEREHLPAKAAVPRTQVDDLGNIVFRAVPPGKYTLVVHLPGHELVIENIDIASG